MCETIFAMIVHYKISTYLLISSCEGDTELISCDDKSPTIRRVSTISKLCDILLISNIFRIMLITSNVKAFPLYYIGKQIYD